MVPSFDFPAALQDELTRLGVAPPPAEALPALELHLERLLGWSRKVNLTAEREPRRALRRHVVEGLAALPWVPDGAAHLVDLGSGNGYPGLLLAACRPGLRATLVEANSRKTAFLRAVARDAGLAGVTVLRTRLESPADLEALRPFDVFSCRAVAGAVSWAERLAGRISPGGRALLFLAAPDARALEAAAPRPGAGPRVRLVELPTRDDAALAVVDYPRA